MRNSKVLRIRKREVFEWLILWIILLPFTFGFLFDLLNFTPLIKYTIDLAYLSLIAIAVIKNRFVLYKPIMPFVLLTILFLVYALIIYVFNFQSLFYFLWGVRNNFRFYIVFFAVSFFMSMQDANLVFKIFNFVFWINAVLSLIQYFAFGYNRDRLGGIFGTEIGVNAYTIIFFLIVLSKCILSYMSKQESAFSCFSKCGTALFIAALAELKAFFLFFFIIVIFSAILTSFSWRKLLISGSLAIAAVLAAMLLVNLFGFENFFSIEKIWETATQEHYSASNTVNRLSAIPVLAKTLLTDFGERVFGLGLGNCDTSSFAICNTPFYQSYGYLRYSWFSCAILFLETGYIGLLIFIAFFVICFINSYRILKSGRSSSLYCQMAMIMSVICVVLTVYNSSLRTEAAYMIYFVLALPLVGLKSDNEQES